LHRDQAGEGGQHEPKLHGHLWRQHQDAANLGDPGKRETRIIDGLHEILFLGSSRSLPGSSRAWANARLIVTRRKHDREDFKGDIHAGLLVLPTPRSAATSGLRTQLENL
jgi:hypothetical protein